jgi:hypothetical protein
MDRILPLILVLGMSDGHGGEEYRSTVLPAHGILPRGEQFCSFTFDLDWSFIRGHFSKERTFACPFKAAKAAIAEQTYQVESYTVQIEHFPNHAFPE